MWLHKPKSNAINHIIPLFFIFLTGAGCQGITFEGDDEYDHCSLDSCDIADRCQAARGRKQDLERECYHPVETIACNNVHMRLFASTVTVLDPDGGCWKFGNVWPREWTLVDASVETECTFRNFHTFPICPEYEGTNPRSW